MGSETCRHCGGRLRPYGGGEYVQCGRCGRAEWRPKLASAAGTVWLTVEPLGASRFRVADARGSGRAHVVTADAVGELACDCADHRYRRRDCKHIAAVREARPALIDEARHHQTSAANTTEANRSRAAAVHEAARDALVRLLGAEDTR